MATVATILLSVTTLLANLSTIRGDLIRLTRGSPVQIYNEWFAESDFDRHWQVDDVKAMTNVLSQTGSNPWYTEHFPGANRVTIEGALQLAFDVESTEESSQVNLTGIAIEFKREPVPSFLEIYRDPHGLGGGVIRDYQAVLEIDVSPDAPNTQIVEATPVQKGSFDFITLSPGEREPINVKIVLPHSGFYQITPIARFQYRSQEYEYRFEQLDIVYPEKFHIWTVSDNGHGILTSFPFTISTTAHTMTIEGLVQNSIEVPITFESSIATLPCYVFTIVDNVAVANTATIEDECSVETSSEKADLGNNLQAKVEAVYGKEFGDISWSPNKKTVALVIRDGTQTTNHTESGKIIMVDNESLDITEIAAPSDWCDSPSWSPSGTRLAFICKYDNGDGYLNVDDPSELWIFAPDGKASPLSTVRSRQYTDPEWSADEKCIIVGGNGIWIIPTDENGQTTTILQIPVDCYQCISNPSWNP